MSLWMPAHYEAHRRLLILDVDDPFVETQSGRARNFKNFLRRHGFKNITIESVNGWPGGSGGHVIKATL